MHRPNSHTLLRIFAPLLLLAVAGLAQADSREKIDAQSQQAVQRLQELVPGIDKLLDKAEGVLVFPDIVKMSFGAGGQFGEGSLLVGGEPVAYYVTAGGDFGLKPGSQLKSEVILFMTLESLQGFRGSQGWQVGVDASVAMVHPPVGGKLKARDIRDPIVGFIFSDKGMLPDLDIEGSKMNRIAR